MSYYKLKNGMKLYYEDSGTGKPIIFMHGWASSHDVYSEPIRLLGNKARCISYDHRGHAKSKSAHKEQVTIKTLACDLNEIIEGLGLNDVTLVGWSMGAGVALSYIRDYGCKALRQVVLCDMSPKQLNDEDWSMGLYKGRYTKATMEENKGKSFMKLFMKFTVGAAPKYKVLPEPLLYIMLRKKLHSSKIKVLESLARSLKEEDLRAVVGQITVPLTYFYAVPGSLFTPKLADWYKENASVEFRSVPFKNSTHKLIRENPEKFALELEKLL